MKDDERNGTVMTVNDDDDETQRVHMLDYWNTCLLYTSDAADE